MKIMNLEEFIEEMDNDYEIVGEIISQYINSIEQQLDIFDNLLAEKAYGTISREAHSIKGGARNVMAEGLEKASIELEESAVSRDDLKIEQSIKKLKDEYRSFKEFIINNLKNINL